MKKGDLVRYRTDNHGSGIGYIHAKGLWCGQYVVFMIEHGMTITLAGCNIEVIHEDR